MAPCLAHDDREQSLSIADAKDCKILVRCHAGCDQRDVIAALGTRGVWGTAGRYDRRSRRMTGRLPPAGGDSDVLSAHPRRHHHQHRLGRGRRARDVPTF
jgi:hypothetical protein